jgi:hypothetical protein
MVSNPSDIIGPEPGTQVSGVARDSASSVSSTDLSLERIIGQHHRELDGRTGGPVCHA